VIEWIIAIVLGIVLMVGIAFAIWWLFIETEGVYLGQRVVTRLYDLYATRYDNIKQNEDTDEHIFLSAPLMMRLRPEEQPLILDIACGTGRMSMAMCRHPRFEGFIVGVELSKLMLAQAVQKIEEEHFQSFADFARADAQKLPFGDVCFDVVTCMEALEFFPSPREALLEMSRVLQAGGILLTTLRWNAQWIPYIWDENTLRTWLEESGFEEIEVHPWQLDYKLVWAKKKTIEV
jgi:SAM-dependent methyltransferase